MAAISVQTVTGSKANVDKVREEVIPSTTQQESPSFDPLMQTT